MCFPSEVRYELERGSVYLKKILGVLPPEMVLWCIFFTNLGFIWRD